MPLLTAFHQPLSSVSTKPASLSCVSSDVRLHIAGAETGFACPLLSWFFFFTLYIWVFVGGVWYLRSSFWQCSFWIHTQLPGGTHWHSLMPVMYCWPHCVTSRFYPNQLIDFFCSVSLTASLKSTHAACFTTLKAALMSILGPSHKSILGKLSFYSVYVSNPREINFFFLPVSPSPRRWDLFPPQSVMPLKLSDLDP